MKTKREYIKGYVMIACKFWDRTPTTMSIGSDVVDELFIFFR